MIMKTYYCEVENEFRPHFPGYKIATENDEAAIERFKKSFGDRIEIIYDEDFEIIYQKDQ